MKTVLIIAADIFVSAMAVFGVWCILRFYSIGSSRRKNLKTAIYINSVDDIEKLEGIIFEADHVFFERKQDKYPLLADEALCECFFDQAISSTVIDRVDVYIRVPCSEIHSKGDSRENQ